MYFKVKNTSVHLIYFPSDVTDVIIAQYSKKIAARWKSFTSKKVLNSLETSSEC